MRNIPTEYIGDVQLIKDRGEQLSIMLLAVSSLLDMFQIIYYRVKLSRRSPGASSSLGVTLR